MSHYCLKQGLNKIEKQGEDSNIKELANNMMW